ncbi:MAG: peptidase M20 [Deltaproteobacteria bacterium]|jgi:hippurate hydrolase|uniref:Peptidase M20 dimerisation domain-containing protein n=1 Tax=marine metagenome TaxID=408172 RepID=A0A381PMB5_9ZZZZ|nr:peptidase M20 [Deltaproteobacteria bacterium]MDP6308278.1 M20 aminoacylase family protein [SAR324 cluster bacterium]MDP7170446.1 M20 aminoacylase family protein [SAR324 cluster bacterium]MDP7437841.1 M20 aminoacylase family protein [SAR324 cluster bacterium]MDP7581875.1 M20 aminoacylase family protein [SAR324 cluster bacterium]|tara:strand:+ start:225 stop:1394 length:1170 start_codon:yes stop_codon:yes gene_type:complete
MTVIKEIKLLHDEMTEWRRDIHQHPELKFEENRTSDLVAAKLEEFGIEIHRGLAKTGVVGTIRNGDGPSIGLRADMDALPLEEKNTFKHASSNPGKMHACGHDGHTAMLLGAAKHLAASKNFKGTVNLIFQPAEEGGGGGELMIKEGLFEMFPVDSVYGLHNWPGMPAGTFGVGSGPIMAAADMFDLTINGRGGHAALPDQCIDPIVVASQVVSALQTITSRNTHPVDSVVISVTQIHAGDAYNVIPDSVRMHGTVRTFQTETRAKIPSSMLRVAEGVCAAYGTTCELNYMSGYPTTINSVPETEISAKAVVDLLGEDKIILNPTPSMGAEDFSYMLEARPGCYVWLGIGPGKGEAGCMLHSSRYDFNDDVLPTGASYWVKLVENELPA